MRIVFFPPPVAGTQQRATSVDVHSGRKTIVDCRGIILTPVNPHSPRPCLKGRGPVADVSGGPDLRRAPMAESPLDTRAPSPL